MLKLKKQVASQWEFRFLKTLIWFFIIAGFVVGGANNALAHGENEGLARTMRLVYLSYETVFRTGVTLLSTWLSLRLLRTIKSPMKMRKRAMLSLSASMIVLMVILPTLLGIYDVSIALMPFLWSTMPLQLLQDGHFFSTAFDYSVRDTLLWIYVGYQVFVLVGTALLGRRFHCAMICPYAGVHAETFSIALPLIKPSKSAGLKSKLANRIMTVGKWNFFLVQVILFVAMTALWFNPDLQLLGSLGTLGSLRTFEMIKYLVFELTLLQVFYIVFNGRGYCYYCPAGTLLGLMGRGFGQRIETNLGTCTQCKRCAYVCEMSIDVSLYAKGGIPIKSLQCVGCGHCIDQCPQGVLRYRTHFTHLLTKRKEKV